MSGSWTFTAACPNGHTDAPQTFERDFLEGSLRFGAPIRFYCSECRHYWNATPEQREVLAGAISTAKGGKGTALKRRMPL